MSLAKSITHAFVSAKADGSDPTQVQPSHWNADHVLTNVMTKGPNTVCVNDFGAVADGKSHPLSETYGTLAEAQLDYPSAIALTDEKDWCAWQGAIEWAYQNCNSAYWKSQGYNMSTATIVADGNYVVNRSIQCYLYSMTIRGSGQPATNVVTKNIGGTNVVYNGESGSVDSPVFLFDSNAADAAGNPPSGKLPIAGGGSVIFRMYDMGVCGREFSVPGNTVDLTKDPDTCGAGYVIGVFLRNNSFSNIERCTFTDGLYDGVVATSQLFLKVTNNFFYKIYRDSFAIWAFPRDFSTTVWVDDNEFGYNGRYAILMDYSSAVEPSPSVRRNSIESTATNAWYYSRPEYWVQGVRGTQLCQINGTYGLYMENRFEGDPSAQIWANVHLINVSNVRFIANRVGGSIGMVLSGFRNTNTYTSAYNSFRTSKGYVDITDQRNINAPVPGNTTSGCGALVVDNLQGMVVVPDGGGWSTSNNFHIVSSQFTTITVPTVAGTYADLIGPTASAIPTMRSIGPSVLEDVYDTCGTIGAMYYRQFNTNTGNTGTYTIETQPWGTWATGVAYKAEYLAPYYNWIPKKWVVPTTYNGFLYECTVSGTSGATEPTWPTSFGATVTDGGATWKCIKRIATKPASGYTQEMMHNSKRTLAPYTAAPSASDGYFAVGDIRYNSAPTSGGSIGWVCTTAGIPGTWKTFGTIA